MTGNLFRIVRSLRQHTFVVVGTILAAGVAVCAGIEFTSHAAHRSAYVRTVNAVEMLIDRRPDAVSKREWAFVVGWTRNAVSNCCASRESITDKNEFHKFSFDLERRCRGDVSMETIDWIWDELRQISRNGKRYSDNWRPTTPERLKQASQVTFLGIKSE